MRRGVGTVMGPVAGALPGPHLSLTTDGAAPQAPQLSSCPRAVRPHLKAPLSASLGAVWLLSSSEGKGWGLPD